MSGNSEFLRMMGTCLPGYNNEAGAVVTLNNGISNIIYTVPANGTIDGIYWVRVMRDAGGNETNVRIVAPGPATAADTQISSNEEHVALGPLVEGQTIAYWGDVAGVNVQYSRIS